MRLALRRIALAGGGYPLAVLGVAVMALVLLPLRPFVSGSTMMLLFVPLIIGVAWVAGVRPSATAAVLAFVALDLLFVPPYYRLTVASLPEWLGLVVFLFVALVSGQQTARFRRRERAALRGRDELALLNRLSFQVASEQSIKAIAEYVVGQVNEVLGGARAALYASSTVGTPECLAQAGLLRPSRGEAALVTWVLRADKAVGMPEMPGVPFEQRTASVGASDAIPGVTAAGVYIPLQASASLEGVLVAEPREGDSFSHDEARLLAAVANLAAAALERERLADDAAHAEVLREADRLKTTLVSSVSHELKTPLAAATARVTGLLDEGETLSAERVHEELVAVAADLMRLNDSIGDLLDFSRLESDAWQPHFEAYEVSEILGTVVSRLSAEQRDRVAFKLAENLPLVRSDFAQLARALSNLVENALLYAPAGTKVEVGSRRVGELAEISVRDSGPGVPDEEKVRIFEKFYRGVASSRVPSGTGLGLAIAREIVRTHDGTLTVEDAAPHGARLVLRIPIAYEES